MSLKWYCIYSDIESVRLCNDFHAELALRYIYHGHYDCPEPFIDRGHFPIQNIEPLRIMRCEPTVPCLTAPEPGSIYVLTKEIVDEILGEGLRISTKEVKLSRVCRYELPLDWVSLSIPDFETPEEFFAKLPLSHKPDKSIRLFELLLPTLVTIDSTLLCFPETTVSKILASNSNMRTFLKHRISELNDWPALAFGGLAVNETLFRILEKCIDQRFWKVEVWD